MHFSIEERTLEHARTDVVPELPEETVKHRLRLLVGNGAASKALSALGVYGLARRSVDELVSEVGLTKKAAEKIVAARELSDALSPKRQSIQTKKQVVLELPLGFERLEREVMLAFPLNGQLEKLATILIAAGGAQMLCVRPRDILRPVLRFGGVGFILVHVHPSGDPTPSEADIVMTNALAVASEVVGLDFVDHVIVAERGSASFWELGLMPTSDELKGKKS